MSRSVAWVTDGQRSSLRGHASPRTVASPRLAALASIVLAALTLTSPVVASTPGTTPTLAAPTDRWEPVVAHPATTSQPVAPALVRGASGASDDRWLVTASSLRTRPYRGVVHVQIGSNTVCTGFVVAPRKVVMAAHCLTRNASGGDFRFRSGLPNGLLLRRGYSLAAGGSDFDSCRVARVWAHGRFIRSGSSDMRYGSRAHDYAVLTTPSGCRYPRSAMLPLWATSASDGQLRAGRRIRLAGYPADPRFNGMNGLNLWRSQGRLLVSDSSTLSVTGFVAQGMSGAPVWRSFGRDSPCGRSQCVIGLITECAVNRRGLCKLGDSARRAVRITRLVKRTIRDH